MSAAMPSFDAAFAEMLAVFEAGRPGPHRPLSPPAPGSSPTPELRFAVVNRSAVALVGHCRRCHGGEGYEVVEVERADRYGPGVFNPVAAPTCSCISVRAHAEWYTAARVPGGLSGRSLDGYEVETGPEPLDGRGAALQLCSGFLSAILAGRRPEGLVLSGVPGVGKSHLLAGIVRAATAEPVAGSLRLAAPVNPVTGSPTGLVRWVSASRFGDMASQALAVGHEALAALKGQLADVPLLVVDELGDGNPGHLGAQVLGEILRERLDSAMPICVATNYRVTGARDDAGSLASRLPEHLADRLLALPACTIACASYRALVPA